MYKIKFYSDEKGRSPVKEYIDQNFISPELRISTLSKLYKTSETYFRREFKKYYGESPIEYIKRRRTNDV